MPASGAGSCRKIGGRCANQAGELAEAPVGRRERRVRARQRSVPGARHRRGSLPRGWPRSPRSAFGCARPGRERRRTAPTGTDSVRPPGARTIRRTRGRFSGRGSHRPCKPRVGRGQRSEYSAWLMGYLHDGAWEPLSPALNPSRKHRPPLTLARASKTRIERRDGSFARSPQCLFPRFRPPSQIAGLTVCIASGTEARRVKTRQSRGFSASRRPGPHRETPTPRRP